jgi:hypothetical protein
VLLALRQEYSETSGHDNGANFDIFESVFLGGVNRQAVATGFYAGLFAFAGLEFNAGSRSMTTFWGTACGKGR